MEVSVHVGVGEGGHVLAVVLNLEVELLVAFGGVCLGFVGAQLHLLHLLLDHAQVVVPLPALLLLLLGLSLDDKGHCRSCRWLLLLLHLLGFG